MGKEQKNGFGIVGIIIIIVVVAVLGGGYWYWQASVETPSENSVVAEGDSTGWKTYRNEEYGFAFKYPSEFAIEQYGNNRSELEMDKGKAISGRQTTLSTHLASRWPSEEIALLVISATPQLEYYGGVLDKPLYVQDGFYYFPSSAVKESYEGRIVAEILSTFKFIK